MMAHDTIFMFFGNLIQFKYNGTQHERNATDFLVLVDYVLQSL
jgi:hypothetical protein